MLEFKFDPDNHNALYVTKDGEPFKVLAIPPREGPFTDVVDFYKEIKGFYSSGFEGVVIMSNRYFMRAYYKGNVVAWIKIKSFTQGTSDTGPK